MQSKINLYNILNDKAGTTFNKYSNIYVPVFFDINQDDDKKNLELLLAQNKGLQVFNAIESQLKDLIKIRNPSRNLTAEETGEKIKAYTNDSLLDNIGLWVYYPWKEKLVHTLNKNEFIELRTSRNKYKITDEERDILSLKKIGVIGLSVGQSVSLTLAMERGFGELRIADFDELELTNLNRLRSGIDNLGIKKTVLVAREIAEIDPFLKVTCFHNGITEENLESFLLENGKLDVLIDECDSVDIKIQCRIVAKKYNIPVLMEASDRGTVDVERFDLEPGRPILHGFIEHLDVSNLKNLKTSEEKIPYILPIAGLETLSSRMKASALEVGQTITTWPQLASAVTLGGGITADICRRILLNQYHQSGRYFVDIEELVKDLQEDNSNENKYESSILPLSINNIKKILETHKYKFNNKNLLTPQLSTIECLVKAAISAPSAGNNQPWKWYFDKENLWLFHDLNRTYSFGDFKNMASLMALGASLENLSIKAKQLQIPISINLLLENNFDYYPAPIAAIQFLKTTSRIEKDSLVDYLEYRCTNRLKGNSEKINEKILDDLKSEMQKISGSELFFITDDEEKYKMAEIIATSERLRIFIPKGHYELFEKELRWSSNEVITTKDGLDIESFELSPLELLGLKLAKDPKSVKFLKEWDLGRGLEKMSSDSVKTASAIGIITMPDFNAQNCVLAGMALERLWLTATKHKISLQPMLAPILHFARLLFSKNSTMPSEIESEFLKLYDIFLKLVHLENSRVALFMFRLSISNNPKQKSLRLPVENVLYL